MSRRRDMALSLRRGALDLVPASAYWRDPSRVEAKLDFQRIEAEEGEAVQEARVWVATALALQMQDVIDRIESPTFRLRRSILRVDTSDIETAFARLAVAAYVDGAIGYHLDVRRADPAHPMPETVGMTAQGTQELIERAARRGRAFAVSVLEGIQIVLDSALSDGKDTAQIVREIQSRYAGLIDIGEAPLGSVAAARVQPKTDAPKVAKRRRGRRMKVRNKAQRELYQATYLPFSKRMRQTLDSYLAESRTLQLSPDQAKAALVTEYTRNRSHAVINEAVTDPETVQLLYTAIRDLRTCDVCEDRDGVVRPKDDEAFWSSATPPMHPRCRCSLVPVLRRERQKVTPKKDLPDETDISPGYGGYDPNRVRTMRRLGRALR